MHAPPKPVEQPVVPVAVAEAPAPAPAAVEPEKAPEQAKPAATKVRKETRTRKLALAQKLEAPRETRTEPKPAAETPAVEEPAQPAPPAPSPAKAPAGPTALVMLAISPWGEVLVDGKSMGISPPMTELELTPGSYRIEIRNGNFKPHQEIYELGSNQTIKIKYKFK
jgi:serine/threonine-protein kinase